MLKMRQHETFIARYILGMVSKAFRRFSKGFGGVRDKGASGVGLALPGVPPGQETNKKQTFFLYENTKI